ncbi:MAG TPA: hypothetical protein DEH78_29015 [Solibacterales bacterium]|nr:hypothetical protein [Bryobacterales bacterium]
MRKLLALAVLAPAGLLYGQLTLTPNPLAGTTATAPATTRTVTIVGGVNLTNVQVVSVTVLPSGAPAPVGTVVTVANSAASGADLVLTLNLQFVVGLTHRITIQGSAGEPVSGTVDIPVVAPPTVGTTPMPNGQVGVAYASTTVLITNGTQPFTIVSTGSFPPGLTLTPAAASFTVAGTPTAPGTFAWTAQVTDAAGVVRTRSYNVTIAPAPLVITTTSLPSGAFNTAYGPVGLAATGGVGPYVWSVDPGPALFTGLSLSGLGSLSGVPSQAGTRVINFRVTDSAVPPVSTAAALSLTITAPPVSVDAITLPTATRTAAYNATFTATGGVPPYTFTVSGGTLPNGLTLAPGGALTGTPTASGSFNFTVRATDGQPQFGERSFTLTVIEPPQVTSAAPPNGTQGVPYSFTFTNSGGQGPFAWALVSPGVLPAGLTLSPGGVISGTPTAAESRTFSVRLTDGLGNVVTAGPYTITIAPPLTIVTTTIPNGTAGAQYAFQFTASGGQGGYSWSLPPAGEVTQTPPPGMTFSAGGLLSGTPPQTGTFPMLVQVRDAANNTFTRSFLFTVGSALTITSTTLPNGSRGTAYAANLTSSGGSGAVTWIVTGGTLPPGLTVAPNGAVTGTPTDSGTFVFNVRASDSTNAQANAAVSLTIVDPPIEIAPGGLPAGRVGRSYSASVRLQGSGVAIFDLAGGSLPPGLSLLGDGSITGVPSASGTFSFNVRASAGTATSTRSFTIRIAPLPPSVTTDSLPEGTVGVSYTGMVGTVGGDAPIRLSATGLPAGLSMSPNGSITGTPTEAGDFTVAVTATDASGESTGRNVSLRIRDPLSGGSSLPNGVVGRQYSAPLTIGGGTPPYSFSLIGGLPAGLSLATTGLITGTPTTEGRSMVEFRATDASGRVFTASVELVIRPELGINAPGIVNNQVPPARRGGDFGFLFEGVGGDPPYRWTMSGAPPGLTIDPLTGRITGSPTRSGVFNITITLTDRGGQTSRTYRLTVDSDLVLGDQTLPPGVLGAAYNATLNRLGGSAPFVFALENGALPTGITLQPDGRVTGIPTQSGTFNFSARVDDADSASAIRAYVLTVTVPRAPGLNFLNLERVQLPARQPVFTVRLQGTYPVGLQGRITLTFSPLSGGDDQTVQFVNGRRTLDFDIAAGSVDPTFAIPQAAFQTGTVAGNITLTAQLRVDGQDVTPQPVPEFAMRVDRAAPVVTNLRATRTANGFEVVIEGYSTPREINTAIVRFTGASSLQTTETTVNLQTIFNTYYATADSTRFGSQFRLTLPFTITGDTNAITGVSVTLTNSLGNSETRNATF